MRAISILLPSSVLVSCAQTVLETPRDHPADPSAYAAPAKQQAAALKPGFDPFEAYPEEAAEPEPTDHRHHDHGGHSAHETPADSNKSSAGAADHAGHSSSEQKPRGPDAGPENALFTCPMHPEMVQGAPGSCPVCGMKLVPKRSDSARPGH
jgi:hypothetical protein